MTKLWILAVALAVALALVCLPARADTLYTYTGNAVGGISLTGDFDLLEPLAFDIPKTQLNPFAYSFTDGFTTLDQANSQSTFSISTGPAGDVDQWFISLWQPEGAQIVTEFYGSGFEATDSTPHLYVEGNRGSWAVTDPPPASTAVPEPAEFVLLAVGLMALAYLYKWNRFNRV